MWFSLKVFSVVIILAKAEKPTWKSLDARQTPAWYGDAKFGIMIHFGIYSATIGSEWFWKDWKRGMPELKAYIDTMKPPGWTYQDFAQEFRAELFDAYDWVDVIEESGAKYVVVTAKHHDGFVLYPSSFSPNWNSVDVGPHIDFLSEFSDAIRSCKTMIKFGIYYSLMEWFHPLYLKDKNESTSNFVTNKMLPELKEIVQLFAPDLVWADGDWESSDVYWQSKEFLSWLFTESSVKEDVVVNDRWGRGVLCKHGSFLTCKDRYNPGIIKTKKFENVLSMDRYSWGFDPMSSLDNILTEKELIRELVTTVACNGNLLLNIGPNQNGKIENIFVERLRQIGKFLEINGEGIFASKPWHRKNDGNDIWFTMKDDYKGNRNLYVFVLEYPFDSNEIILSDFAVHATGDMKISLLGYSNKIDFSLADRNVIVKFPEKRFIDKAGIRIAWTFRININSD